MPDIATIAIAIACLAFLYVLVDLLDRTRMSPGDTFALVACVLVFAYLLYALFRAESF